MKKVIVSLASLVISLVLCAPARAQAHRNAWGGGSTYHSGNSTTRTNAYGGSATHTAGQGTTATNAYGGSAYHAEGSGKTTATNAYGGSATHTAGQGTTATNAYGGSAYHAEGSGTTTATNAYGGSATHYAGYGTVATSSSGQTAYHPPAAYYGYHPPTTAAYYGTTCYNCTSGSTAGATAAGAVVGMAVGAAAASSNVQRPKRKCLQCRLLSRCCKREHCQRQRCRCQCQCGGNERQCRRCQCECRQRHVSDGRSLRGATCRLHQSRGLKWWNLFFVRQHLVQSVLWCEWCPLSRGAHAVRGKCIVRMVRLSCGGKSRKLRRFHESDHRKIYMTSNRSRCATFGEG